MALFCETYTIPPWAVIATAKYEQDNSFSHSTREDIRHEKSVVDGLYFLPTHGHRLHGGRRNNRM